jgi:hypothetical protein
MNELGISLGREHCGQKNKGLRVSDEIGSWESWAFERIPV